MAEINKEAFVELRGRLVDTTSRLKQVQLQLRSKEAEQKRALLTLDELNYLPDDTNSFKSVGKAFILEPKAQLVSELQSKAEECEAALKNLNSSREYLEKQLKEVEGNFKELLEQSPALTRGSSEGLRSGMDNKAFLQLVEEKKRKALEKIEAPLKWQRKLEEGMKKHEEEKSRKKQRSSSPLPSSSDSSGDEKRRRRRSRHRRREHSPSSSDDDSESGRENQREKKRRKKHSHRRRKSRSHSYDESFSSDDERKHKLHHHDDKSD